MKKDKSEYVTSVAIISRRLKKGKTYDDFRKAWFHTTGFALKDKDKGGGNSMFSMINIFDPREVVVVGFSTSTLGQLKAALDIDVKVRGANPLDKVIEPEIGRKFCALVAEDDFSAAGKIPFKAAGIAGRKTDMEKFDKNLKEIKKLYTAAAKKRDKLNAARVKK